MTNWARAVAHLNMHADVTGAGGVVNVPLNMHADVVITTDNGNVVLTGSGDNKRYAVTLPAPLAHKVGQAAAAATTTAAAATKSDAPNVTATPYNMHPDGTTTLNGAKTALVVSGPATDGSGAQVHVVLTIDGAALATVRANHERF